MPRSLDELAKRRRQSRVPLLFVLILLAALVLRCPQQSDDETAPSEPQAQQQGALELADRVLGQGDNTLSTRHDVNRRR